MATIPRKIFSVGGATSTRGAANITWVAEYENGEIVKIYKTNAFRTIVMSIPYVEAIDELDAFKKFKEQERDRQK